MFDFRKLDFRFTSQQRQDLTIHTGTLLIRPPHLIDYESWADLRAESRSFLQPWEPTWPEDDLTKAAYKRRMTRYRREMEKGEGFPFLIFRSSDHQLLGGLNLTNIRRGAASMATLGYWMGRPYAGQGLMSQAVSAVLHLAHSSLSLRRMEASCLPQNQASIRLLEKNGFCREGVARDYLMIDGQWRDHLLYATVFSAETGHVR